MSPDDVNLEDVSWMIESTQRLIAKLEDGLVKHPGDVALIFNLESIRCRFWRLHEVAQAIRSTEGTGG